MNLSRWLTTDDDDLKLSCVQDDEGITMTPSRNGGIARQS